MNKKIRKQIYQEAIEGQGNIEGKESRPTWFAIKEYYDVIKKYLENIAGCIIAGKYKELFRSLKGLFFYVKPYIEPSKAQDIKTKIKKAYNLYNYQNKNSVLSNKFEKELDGIVEDLFVASKNIFLPTREEEDDDGNFDPTEVI